MSIGFNTAIRTARSQLLINAMDGGATAGLMRFYDGVRPVTGGAVTTLVGENELFDPSGSVADGLLTFNLVSDEMNAKANADVTWCRIVDSDDNFVMDLGCGESGSGEEIIFDSITAQIGGVLKIISGAILEGNL